MGDTDERECRGGSVRWWKIVERVFFVRVHGPIQPEIHDDQGREELRGQR